MTRQYAWQIVHYRTPLSLDRALEIEREVDAIITDRPHLRSFGDRLRAARVSAGLTLKEVAELIGYTWVGVERWEKNVCRPKPGVLWHLCSVYEIPLTSFELASRPQPGRPGIRAELAESLLTEGGLASLGENRSAFAGGPSRANRSNGIPRKSQARHRAA